MDLDEMAHHEPPHQDQHCLQIMLFASLVLKELMSCQRICAVQQMHRNVPEAKQGLMSDI